MWNDKPDISSGNRNKKWLVNKETILCHLAEGFYRSERSHTFLSRKGGKHKTLFFVDRRGDGFYCLNRTEVVY